MSPNYDDDLKRQIEKERIREQIIAEEVTRRRILEEEVRRELMIIENDLSLRSLQQPTMGFGYSNPFFGHGNSKLSSKLGVYDESRTGSRLEIGFRGSDYLPLQRNPDTAAVAGLRLVSDGVQPLLQPSKDAIVLRNPDMAAAAGSLFVSNAVQPLLQPSKDTIVLEKPETNVCGQKRKSPTPEADREGHNTNPNKKVKGWNCVLCNVKSTSEIDFNVHMQGRKHRAKVTQEKSHGTTAVVKICNSSNKKPITALVSTSDPGVNKAGKGGGESLGSVHGEAAEAGKQISVQSINIITYPISDDKASDVGLPNIGHTPKKAMPSAMSSEKSNFWCEMCKVGTTCANDMSAHEAGKKHLAKLHKYIPPKDMSMSCSTKLLCTEKGAQGINGCDALLKETEKEITQDRLESTFIPFEMLKMQNANVGVTGRDSGSNVKCPLRAAIQKGLSEHRWVERDVTKDAGLVVVQTTSFGAGPEAKSCCLSTESSNTSMGSTRNSGVKIAFKPDGKSSENVDSVAAVAEKQNSAGNLNDKTDPKSSPKAKDAGSNGNVDKSEGGRKKHLAKLHKAALSSSESSASKILSMEKAVLAKEIEETEEEVTQSELQNMNIISCPRSHDKASDVAKSLEKSNFWCEMCKVGATCANDMAAHEAGKKHLAKLRKYITPKDMSMSCSTKPLCMEKGTQGINGGHALVKETVKEIAQERLESTFIPFEMSKMLNADVVVVTGRDNGGNVLCSLRATTSLGTSPVAKSCSLSTETSNTAMGRSTCDPGVKILSMEKAVLAKEIGETEEEVTQSELEGIVIPSEMEKVKTTIHDTSRGDGSSVLCPLSATSESGVDEHKQGEKNKAMEAELVVQKTVNPIPEESIITPGIEKAIADEQGGDVNSTKKVDAPGPQITQPSAESCEKFKFWNQVSQVETCCATVLSDDQLYEEPCALPDLVWVIEEVAEDVVDEDAMQDG